MMFRKKGTLIVSISCICLVVVLLLVLRKRPVSVDWMVVHRKEALETVLANGRVGGSRVTPLSLLKNGIVKHITVTEGSRVHEGDTLLVLDNREEKNRVAQRQNDLRIANLHLQRLKKESYNQAKEQLHQAQIREMKEQSAKRRADTLFLQGSITRSQLDDMHAAADISSSQRLTAETELNALTSTELSLKKAQEKLARLQLSDAMIQLSKTVLFAPSDGQVIDILVEEGQLATPEVSLILFLPKDTALLIELQVDESEISAIHKGQKAKVTPLGTNPVTMNAFVEKVIGRIDTERGTGTVILMVPNQEIPLIIDQTVTAQIFIGTIDNALVLEPQFYNTTIDGDIVFVLSKMRAKKSKVLLTVTENGKRIVRNGLSEGDTVINAPFLSEGSEITLKKIKQN